MRKRLSRIRKRINETPEMRKIADSLRASGEAGRAIPGQQLQQIRANIGGEVKEGKPEIPSTNGRTEVSTYFTKPSGNHVLYRAEQWMRIRLMLEGAGPVAVGSRDNVAPPLSGAGILLPTNVEITFTMQKGNRMYIAATAINRVRFIIEPIPWLEQIATMIGQLVSLGRRGQ